MIEQLLQDIINYFEQLKQKHKIYVAFHNATIPLGNYMAQLSPYNINSNPYCLCVKTNDQAWAHCIKRQPKVFEKCKKGPFIGTCYAGMGEYVFPILDFEQKVLGFIDVSGYCFDMKKSQSCICYISKEYAILPNVLEESYVSNIIEPPYELEELRSLISPLCYMFVLLNLRLVALYGNVPTEHDTHNYTLSHAVVFLERNYTQPIQLTDVAQACHCSVSYISHIFKDSTGTSILSYVNNLRIKDAKKLLLNTRLSIKQIAEMIGFGSPNYMCEVFHRNVGISPRDFRNLSKKTKDENAR